MRTLAMGLLLTLPYSVATASVPPITGIVFTAGSLSWDPIPAASGYRVYRADNRNCCSYTVIYDGPDTQVFISVINLPSIYRIAAYIGPIEGPASPPFYSYFVELPAYVAGNINKTIVSPPYANTFTGSRELCQLANWGTTAQYVQYISRFNTLASSFTIQQCLRPDNVFPVEPGRAYFYEPTWSSGRQIVWMWGMSDGSWAIDLLAPSVPQWYKDHVVALPYDHVYPDVAAVVAEIPSAVAVRSMDSIGFIGLFRASTADPWQGTNFSLTDRLGQGLMIAVESPVTWHPRQYCTGPVHVASQCPTTDSAACDGDCTPAICGDGYENLAAGEQCDDGNTIDGDGCSAHCQICVSANLTRLYPLLAVKGVAPAVVLSWAPDVTTPVAYHVTSVPDKVWLEDPRSQPYGVATRECTTAVVPMTTTCIDADAAVAPGTTFYQALSSCGPNGNHEGPF